MNNVIKGVDWDEYEKAKEESKKHYERLDSIADGIVVAVVSNKISHSEAVYVLETAKSKLGQRTLI